MYTEILIRITKVSQEKNPRYGPGFKPLPEVNITYPKTPRPVFD